MNKLNGTRPLARYAIASGSTIKVGDLVALNSSDKAIPAAETANVTVIGYAEMVEDGMVEVGDGVVAILGGTTGTVDRFDRGKVAYVEDAQHVKVTGGTNAVPAGIIVDVYDGEVYIDITPAAIKAAKGN